MEASRILRFSRQFGRFYAACFVPLLERTGWSMAEVHVLLFLANNPGLDTARDIVALRGLAKSQVSQAVERLTDQGVLSRCPDEADRRIIHLAITQQGRESGDDHDDGQAHAHAGQRQLTHCLHRLHMADVDPVHQII